MIYLPVLIPLSFSIITLLSWKFIRLQRILAIIGSSIVVLNNLYLFFLIRRSGIQAAQIGNWPSPFGISLVVDSISSILLLITSIAAFAAAIFSLSSIDSLKVRWGFYPLFFFLMMGVNGAFTTGDLFNLYVWFEVMLMASFVLMTLGGEQRQLEGGLKYVILNLMSSLLFLSAVGLTYHYTGTLNLANLATLMKNMEQTGPILIIAGLFLSGFGIKAAMFPFFFWLPASYHTPPVIVTSLFSGTLTKVGFYAMLRVFSLLFSEQWPIIQPLLLVLAGLTMLTGVLGAASQTDFRRLLSFHIISQIGYLLMGLALFSIDAIGAVIYFAVHVIIAKMALFFIADIVNFLKGTFDLRLLGGLYKTNPYLAVAFLIPALALAGLPPLSGFFAKLLLIIAGFHLKSYLIVIVALVVSILTLFSMTKIWNEVFWKPAPATKSIVKPEEEGPKRVPLTMWVPVIITCLIVVFMGVFADPLITVAGQAAAALLDPGEYITAIQGMPR